MLKVVQVMLASPKVYKCNPMHKVDLGEQMSPEIYPIPQAQALLGGISRQKVYDLIDDQRLERVHLGRRAFITRSSIENLLASITSQVEGSASHE